MKDNLLLNRRLLAAIALSALFALGSGASVEAQHPPDRQPATTESADPISPDERAIRKSAADYAAAYNRRDAKALAAFWSPEAVYTSRVTGDAIVGREAIEKEFSAQFADKDPFKLEVAVEGVDFVSPNVAIERGTARVVGSEGGPMVLSYSAVHVKRDGRWLMDRVSEEPIARQPSVYEHLKDLEWMIGDWVDEDPEARIETECRWAQNKSFITRSFAAKIGGRTEMSGVQVVGWDPAAKKIRSWVFDSDGGFSEGTWTRKDNRWFIKSTGVLADGTKISATNVLTYVDDDRFKWSSIDREAGGHILPNVPEVLVVRDQSAE